MNKKYIHDLGLLCMAVVACSLIARFLAHGETLAEYAKEKEQAEASTIASVEVLASDSASNSSSETGNSASSKNTGSDTATTATVYKDGFSYQELPQDIIDKITGVSYVENDNISLDELSYLNLLYIDFDGNTQNGELICNEKIAEDILEIFYELYESGYQIESIKLIDEFGGDDTASMLANNTSCFNYRVVEGSSKLSKHAYGLAIDLNPFYNPYITYNKDGSQKISPAGSEAYADRSTSFPYKIDENDLAYKLFTEHGFKWGGNWNSVKDYQHFEYVQ